MDLAAFFRNYNKIALAFSGGTDSAYLLYAAKASGAQVKAYYVKTPFQPEFELTDAKRLARELGAVLQVIPLDILQEEAVCSNPKNRCYFCKKKLFSAILEAARLDGFTTVIDGTNASDDASDRPGMQALEEMNVLSPLRLCGLTKAEVRRLSREAGLFTHDKPANACLATRIPAGVPITQALLARTEWAEDYLKDLGFSNFRVRLMGDAAKLQIPGCQLPLLLQHREDILTRLKEKYTDVLLDLEVRDESRD